MSALRGVRILDLTHMLSGPYGTMLLADLGAEVIKVEPPGKGEGTRQLLAEDPKNSIEGMGAYFLTLSRNKKSVTLDLKKEEGLGLFYELVKKSDVVANNFRPGVVERLKIDYPSLAAINPAIITCSITGFGATGPLKDRPAFDLVAQGFGGGMSITGEPEGEPMRAGIPIGDLGGGLFGAIGILTALVARQKTGLGQDIDISMMDGQISLLNYMATMHFLSGEVPKSLGNKHFVHIPYGVFQTKTISIILTCLLDEFYVSLAKMLENPLLLKPEYEKRERRMEEKDLINETIQEELLKWDGDELLAALERKGIPSAPVNTFDRTLSSPQALARNMVVEGRHPNNQTFKMPGNPVKLSATPGETFDPPPLLGQHNREVYRELLGLAEDEIEALAGKGVV